LLAKGAEVNAKDNNGKTPLDVAPQKCRHEVMALLREHGAKP
jgi:ankyrin repeat protein